MGFLTDGERQSLRIARMILHVVGEDPFVEEPARAVEHAEFFLERILSTDIAAVYSFSDTSGARANLEQMALGDLAFEAGAQALSRDFSRLHGGAARDGAFFIFELHTDDPDTRLYSLIKYDYREAIEQIEADEGNHLRRIVHAFVDDKKAIQKSALVRVVNGQADAAISAHDRSKAAPVIADYFVRFLEVERSRSDEELSRDVRDAVRKTLQESATDLPDRDVARAFHVAVATLRDRQQIDEAAITDAVLAAAGHPQDPDTQEALRLRTHRHVRTAKLTGVEFRPDRNVFRRPPLRKLRTTEGVTLTYPAEINAVTVQRNPRAEGGEVITITTDQIVEDKLVRDSAG